MFSLPVPPSGFSLYAPEKYYGHCAPFSLALVYYQSGKLSKLQLEFIRTPRVANRKMRKMNDRRNVGLSFLCSAVELASERNLGKANRLVVTRINKPDRPNEMNCVRLIAEP